MKKVIFILFLIVTTKVFSQDKPSFIYTNKKVTIEVKVGNSDNTLKKNKRNAVTVVVKNLDSRTFACSAPGLTLRQGTTREGISLWEVNLEGTENKGPYTFRFAYTKDKKRFKGQFEIPIE